MGKNVEKHGKTRKNIEKQWKSMENNGKTLKNMGFHQLMEREDVD